MAMKRMLGFWESCEWVTCSRCIPRTKARCSRKFISHRNRTKWLGNANGKVGRDFRECRTIRGHSLNYMQLELKEERPAPNNKQIGLDRQVL